MIAVPADFTKTEDWKKFPNKLKNSVVSDLTEAYRVTSEVHTDKTASIDAEKITKNSKLAEDTLFYIGEYCKSNGLDEANVKGAAKQIAEKGCKEGVNYHAPRTLLTSALTSVGVGPTITGGVDKLLGFGK